MEALPAELTEQVLLNLPFHQLQNVCRVNTQAVAICRLDTFWRRYLTRNYLIQPLPEVDPRQLVAKAQRILNGFFAQGSYPSYRVLGPMVLTLDEERIEFEVNNTVNDLVSIYSIQYLDRYLRDIQPLFPDMVVPVLPGDINLDDALNSHTQLQQLGQRRLTRDEHAYISTTINSVSQPTQYFTPDGLVTIPYDIDRAVEFIGRLGRLELDSGRSGAFTDFMYSVFSDVSTYMYLRYAP
jgi:hypothetical protein